MTKIDFEFTRSIGISARVFVCWVLMSNHHVIWIFFLFFFHWHILISWASQYLLLVGIQFSEIL